MRMRRKSNLDERIRRCTNSLLFIETEEFYNKTEEEKLNIFNFDEVYGNNNPLWIEIGCGKGQFAFELAKRNPNVNVLAVEKISNVILDGTERAEKEKPINLKFLNASIIPVTLVILFILSRPTWPWSFNSDKYGTMSICNNWITIEAVI